jgi:uncharacterized protein (DUF488 family)
VAIHAVFTIGHSTHSLQEFVQLLREHEIKRIADVRSIPKSRHVPQFNRETLEASLREAGLGYTHLAALGGRRHGRKDSLNTGWRNASFRAYADYMATPQFAEGLAELMRMANHETTAVMCAEAVPWRCHRSLIADALLTKGWTVFDIMSAAPAIPHKPTPFLNVEDGKLTYPAPDSPGTPLLFDDPGTTEERG